MTDEERRVDTTRASDAIHEQLAPLLTEGGKGLVAMRVFYAVAHGDGTFSAGQIGIANQDNILQASMLARSIPLIMSDPHKTREFGIKETKPKQ